MLFMKYLFYFIVLPQIISIPHINLYYTDSVSRIENDNNNAFRHNCLRITAFIDKSEKSRQIVSYCMDELSLKLNIDKIVLFPKFTFADLSKQNITSEQLYLWSAPIDLIERYQFYLNDLSLKNEIFYNCTLPRFGLMCEYEFEYYHPDHLSLYHIIRDFYLSFKYEPTEMTCYTHLQCYRGPFPSCLDWTEICDRKIDCYDTGLDEKNCWELEINECNENEFRCFDGQCIPKSFTDDHSGIPDCVHGSDIDMYFQSIGVYDKWDSSEPLFGYDDITEKDSSLTSSYVKQRHSFLFQALFSIKDNNVSNKCWSVLKCIIKVPDSLMDETCDDSIMNTTYFNIVNKMCPDMIFIPAVPVLFNDIYFAYTKEAILNFIISRIVFSYICYNNSRYDKYYVNESQLIFNNRKCHVFINEYLFTQNLYDTLLIYVDVVYSQLRQYSPRWKYASNIYNTSNMYQCDKSFECISMYRLIDGMSNCPYNDDEDHSKINSIYQMKKLEHYFFKCSTFNKTISKNQVNDHCCDCNVINDGRCDRNYDLCEDEIRKSNILNSDISFQKLCNRFIQVLPIVIDGKNYTDETECEQWPCNNIYSRCDHIWDCHDGSDEAGCYISNTLNCSSHEYICVSPETKQFICLSLMKLNDGIIDCLGALDEPNFCPNMVNTPSWTRFFCMGNQSTCLHHYDICDDREDCDNGDDEQFCYINSSNSIDNFVISSFDSSVIRFKLKEFVKNTVPLDDEKQGIDFSLDGIGHIIEGQTQDNEYTILPPFSLIHNIEHQELYCHRGFNLPIHSNYLSNSTTMVCFCPPNYYGNRCQYQNQRISLALRFQATPHSAQTLFAIIVSLIDNDNNTRIIHSYEQFSYLSARDCSIVFNIYLLYSTRPKYANKHYSIHIDIYEKLSLGYRSSLLIPIKFSSLPVHRLPVFINIPGNNNSVNSCSKHKCIHGKCIKYWNNSQDETFCQCNRGWSGRYCTIQHNCTCSLDSLCIGVDANSRSVCICPMNHFGPRCLIIDTTCIRNTNSTCQNGGQCIPNDEYIESVKKFTCICPIGFSGRLCEIIENRITVSFEKDIDLLQSIFIHFFQIVKYQKPRRTTTFRTIISKYDLINIFWSLPFHLIFIEIPIPKKNYYLAVVQNNYNRSIIISKTIHSSDRCQNISEIFNETIIKLHLIRRIKYYHLPCQDQTLNLSCFYDDIHLCLCQQLLQKRVANCFEFNHNQTIHCSNQNDCENNGQCFVDQADCPRRVLCLCPVCSYGIRCQFSTSGFGLSLDTILGYHISPSLPLTKQSFIMKLSLALTIIFFVIGLINSFLSIISFKDKTVRNVGCGLYLLCASIITLLITIILGLKFVILILSQLTIISNQLFLSLQCHSIDFLLRIFLSMDQWLSACVTLERTLTVTKGTYFDKKKSKKAAVYVIIILGIIIIASFIHDPIYRHLVEEENDNVKRIWCIVTYSDKLKIFDSIINPFHVLVPFTINFLSAIILITKKTDQQSTIKSHETYGKLLKKHFREHKNLLIAPIVLVLLALPRIIIAFAVKCMKSVDQSWIFLLGYFFSVTPPMLTFIIFILPSKFYKKQFRQTISQYRTFIQRILRISS